MAANYRAGGAEANPQLGQVQDCILHHDSRFCPPLIQYPGSEVEIIDVSGHRSRRPLSPKWRELIKKVWEADPLICPTCSREMRIVALIDQREVIGRILRHLGLWEEGVPLHPARAPPEGEGAEELFPGDPFPDYSADPVMEYDLCANG
jgi:hypothetical protein